MLEYLRGVNRLQIIILTLIGAAILLTGDSQAAPISADAVQYEYRFIAIRAAYSYLGSETVPRTATDT